MYRFNLNKITMRTFLSEEAQAEVTDTLERKVLTTVMYHFRYLCKGVVSKGYWFVRTDELCEFIGASDDELFDALDNLCQKGFLVVEQHSDWLWFRFKLDVFDKSMSKLMATELCEVMSKHTKEQKALANGGL